MDLNLKGKTGILLGSSKGIGFGVARELLEEGAKVVICSRSEENLKKAESKLKSEFTDPDLLVLRSDTSTKEGIQSIIDLTKQDLGTIDMLLNNTGGPPAGKFMEITDEQWDKGFYSLLMSTVRLIRGIYPYLSRNGASIVNILSRSAKVYLPNLVLSNTFRPAISGLAKTLSIEYGSENIRVNNVCPGTVQTERQEELTRLRSKREGMSMESITASILSDIPLGRIGNPSDLAPLIAFLFSSKSSYITGQTIVVDGGTIRSI